ncbi:MAG TPA: crossover junction endodeoxyribonuclease RuvC [Steroidobacteraceae bacterium]|nr:crossover junction endodeoxyribonuclease RuvC [Steroidobacteraceae bacterium]
MARYPMRSAWRSYQPAAEAAPATIIARISSAGSARILGLDPGSLRTGFGIIDCESGNLRIVAQGCIATSGGALANRLRTIHARVAELITQHSPQEIAVERVFLSKNADSALKLGQARGAALAAVPQTLGVHEYAPRAIKLAVVGIGGAEKAQVAHMVRQLLRLDVRLTADAADALAVAICHASYRRLERLVNA